MHETEWMWKDTKLIWANTLTILGAEATKRNLEHEILCSSPSVGGKLRMWLGITRISVVKVKSRFVSLSTQIWIVPIRSTSAPESPYIIIIWLICITLFSFFFLVVGRWKAESNFISYVERTSESDARCVRRLRWKKRSEESHDLDVIICCTNIGIQYTSSTSTFHRVPYPSSSPPLFHFAIFRPWRASWLIFQTMSSPYDENILASAPRAMKAQLQVSTI